MKQNSHHYQRVTEPTAFVTKGRQRVKQYKQAHASLSIEEDVVYLKNGEEFEIELFNPLQTKILAKIKLNGEYISTSGIVLRPGERVFLERYLDEAKKFLFETYEVDGADLNVKKAIKNNGEVEVEFYAENVILPISEWSVTYSSCYSQQPTGVNYRGTTYPMFTYDAQSNTNNIPINGNIENSESFSGMPENSIETGRVEKGNYSNQSFIADTAVFHSYYSWKSFWKILPESQRYIMKENLVVYCSNCGAKRKKSSHRFCPICGTKY